MMRLATHHPKCLRIQILRRRPPGPLADRRPAPGARADVPDRLAGRAAGGGQDHPSNRGPRRLTGSRRGRGNGPDRPEVAGPRLGRGAVRPERAGRVVRPGPGATQGGRARLSLHLHAGRDRAGRERPARGGRRADLSRDLRPIAPRRMPRPWAIGRSPGGSGCRRDLSAGTTSSSARSRWSPAGWAAISSSGGMGWARRTSSRWSWTMPPWA